MELSLAPPFTMTRERDLDDRPDKSGARPRQCLSSDDDELESPTFSTGRVGGGLLGGGGRVVRHVDSFVRSTRHRGLGRPDEPNDQCACRAAVVPDDEGSPRSRRLTFEFRNFNLFPDPQDGDRSPGLLEKRRPSRSLDIPRVDEEPEYTGYLTSPTFSTFAQHDASYNFYGHMAPQSPQLIPMPSMHTRPPEVLPVITASPLPPSPHSYRSIQTRPVAPSRTYSDVGPSRRPGERREKKVVTLREAVPVPIRDQDEDGSSDLSEPEDADGPSKSGDSSVTSGPRQRRKLSRARKKKPYKSRRCDICNKTFTKECDVTRHRRTAHGEDEIEFKCHECGRLFNRKDALERHYKVYEGTPHVARRYQPKTYLGQKK